MTILKILTIPDQSLKSISNDIDSHEITNEWHKTFYANMIETATANDLVGLAANQVGVMQRVFIVDLNAIDHPTEEKIEKNFQVFINSKIIDLSYSIEYRLEGCASIPNVLGKVSRSTGARLSWIDIDGQSHNDLFMNFTARIIQHESDHLDGILLTDRTKMIRQIKK